MNPNATPQTLNLRALMLAVGGAVLFLLIIFFAIRFFTIGQLDITTNSSNNSITVARANVESQPSGFPKKAKGNLSLSLNAGEYIVDVQGNSVASSQVIAVTAHSTASVNISPPNATGVEPVTFDNPVDFKASATQLVYLNSNDASVNEISAGNAATKFGASYGFQTVQWADPTFGVAQDGNGKLYLIDDGTISPLNTPVEGQDVVFAVSSDRTIFLADDNNVYSGHATGGFKQIYSRRPEGTSLAAGPGGKVAIFDGGENEEDEDTGNHDKTSSDVSDAGLIIVDSEGNSVEKDIDPVDVAWSPSGNYLAVSTQSGSTVLNTSLAQIATIPQANFGSAVWLDDNVLYYKLQDQLWAYNMNAEEAHIIANMPLGEAIQDLSLSTDNAYIYLSTQDASGNVALRRVPLHGQGTSEVVFNLQDILPQSAGDYNLGLTNFNGTPTVIVTPVDGVASQTALAEATQQLQSDGFNLGQINVALSP